MPYQLYNNLQINTNDIVITRNRLETETARNIGCKKVICIFRPISDLSELTSNEVNMLSAIDNEIIEQTTSNNSMYSKTKTCESLIEVLEKMLKAYDSKNTSLFQSCFKQLIPLLRVNLANMRDILNDPLYISYKPRFEHLNNLYDKILAKYSEALQKAALSTPDLSGYVSREDYLSLQISTVPKEQYDVLLSTTVPKEQYDTLLSTTVSKEQYDTLLSSTVSKEQYDTLLLTTVSKSDYETLQSNFQGIKEEYDSLKNIEEDFNSFKILAMKEYSNLENTYNALKQEYEIFKEANSSSEEYEVLRQEHEALKQEYEDMKSSMISKEEHEALKQEYEDLKSNQKTKEFETLKSDYENLKNEYDSLKNETVSLEEYNSLKSETVPLEEYNTLKMYVENSTTNEEYNLLKTQYDTLQETNSDLNEKYENLKQTSISKENFDAVKKQFEEYKLSSVDKASFDALKVENDTLKATTVSKTIFDSIKSQLDTELQKTSLFTDNAEELSKLKMENSNLKANTVSCEEYNSLKSEYEQFKETAVPPEEIIRLKNELITLQNSTVPKEMYEKIAEGQVPISEYEALKIEKASLESQLLAQQNSKDSALTSSMNFIEPMAENNNYFALIKELKSQIGITDKDLPFINVTDPGFKVKKTIYLQEDGTFQFLLECVTAFVLALVKRNIISTVRVVIFDDLRSPYKTALYKDPDHIGRLTTVNPVAFEQNKIVVTDSKDAKYLKNILNLGTASALVIVDRLKLNGLISDSPNMKTYHFVENESFFNICKLKKVAKDCVMITRNNPLKVGFPFSSTEYQTDATKNFQNLVQLILTHFKLIDDLMREVQ